MSLQTRVLNFALFTSLPSTPSSSLFSRRDGVRRRRRPRPSHASRPGQTRPPRPWSRRNQPPWHLPRATRRRTSSSRRRRSRRPSHASPRHCPRRRSSCPHRFMMPIPSSPLPLLALEPELELSPALERRRRPPGLPPPLLPRSSPLQPPSAPNDPTASSPSPL